LEENVMESESWFSGYHF